VLYSHDTMGLGHQRRNLLIARVLARAAPGTAILLIGGAVVPGTLGALPPGVDVLILPGLHKDLDGRYGPRHLDVGLRDLVALRARIISEAVEAFAPDAAIVDNVPLGALGELRPTLERLRAGRHARCVLGLRDILDEPDVVRREWEKRGNLAAIRDFYDAVWVYGDPGVYNLVQEYALPRHVGAKVRFTGYLDQSLHRTAAQASNLGLTAAPLAVCVVGGGQDGARLAQAFAAARLPDGWQGVLVLGPWMPDAAALEVRRLGAGNPALRVVPYMPEPTPLIAQADRVVAMGGYNSVGEVLAFAKHALIVPRVRPRREQLLRAERMRDLGLIHLLHPDELTPEALTAWLARDLGPPPAAHGRVNLGGLLAIPPLLAELLSVPVSPVRVKMKAVARSGDAR
jgi:predicted glycosyltransferase